MFESIRCFGLETRTPRVHVLPSLTAPCQVCALSLQAGQSTYKGLEPTPSSVHSSLAPASGGTDAAWRQEAGAASCLAFPRRY